MTLGMRSNVHSSVLRHLEAAGLRVQRGLARIGKGERITTAAEDPAGLGLSERMRARLLSERMAQRNVDHGRSMVRSSEAALGQVAELLIRMREVAVASSNGTHGANELAIFQGEWDGLVLEIERLSKGSSFSGNQLLGSSATIQLQVGTDAGEVIRFELTDLEPLTRRLRNGGPLGTGSPSRSITLTARSLDWISDRRAGLGAAERRLASAAASLRISEESLAASESRVRDADLAFELAELAAATLVQLSATAVVAQANRQGDLVLDLLAAVPPPTPSGPDGPLGAPQDGGNPGQALGQGSFLEGKDRFPGNGSDTRPIRSHMPMLSVLGPLFMLAHFVVAPGKLAAGEPSVVPQAGPDLEVRQGEVANLSGFIQGMSPLDFYVADGNGEFENMLVRFSDRDGVSAVGPMRQTTGKLMGWTGDLVRIEDRVYGIDVGARYVYVADLEGGLCLPVTPKLDSRWKGLQSLAYDAEGDNLYSVDLTSGTLLEIHRGTGQIDVINAADLRGRKGIRSLAFDQELELLFAADHVDNLLFAIDPSTGALADMMSLPAVENSIIEELAFFQGELYLMRGMKDLEGNTIGGQLQRVNLRSGYVENVGPMVKDVSPHAMLINSVPETFYWAQVGGPAVAELEFTTLLETSARFPEPGRYEFALTVLTADGPVSDRVSVLVTAAAQE